MLRASDRRGQGRRDWIAPGTSVVFTLLMVWLAPNYRRWFGEALPAFTRAFIDAYPLWLAISTVALALALFAGQVPPLARHATLRRALDTLLTIAVVLIVSAGIIALALPLLGRPEPD